MHLEAEEQSFLMGTTLPGSAFCRWVTTPHSSSLDSMELKVWFQNRRRRDKLNYENQKMKET
ncbi:hypothetical protein ANCDUO_08183 [Ancylostoma duodenale]|uniref:Homeobox domain-containing protein n=1 Tax=Ancylostoma duodenale TaxID=51022 RepID=A0A0C2GWP3_9BILA|nr:hypothetical protein ANCDUO_08183 [Ancylostoma duodenale]